MSRPPFDTLNLTAVRGDDPRAVETNRERVRLALGLRGLVFACQVHGGTVLRVDGARSVAEELGEADALITDTPGIGLVAQAADCVPVLIVDPERPAVAAVHSGWRGVAADVTGAAVRTLGQTFGSTPGSLLAAIGPAISKARYRVGPEVLEACRGTVGELDSGLIGPIDEAGGATLDVGEAVRRQLVRAGVRPENVERLGHCTFDDPRFFSSRRAAGAPFGGQAGVIGLMST